MNPSTHTFGESRFFDAGNSRKLHYMVKGTGDITVVFESGMGASRSNWGLVMPVIAEHARAVVYDRAGLGKSDVDSEPRTLERMAGDLVLLLNELGEGPFILVGHSWGGPIVRRAVEKLRLGNSPVLRGLVLVDPSDENADLYFSKAAAGNFALMRKIMPGMARIGLTKLMSGGPGRCQPEDVVADHLAEDFTVPAARTAVAEMTPFLKDLAELRTKPAEIGDVEVAIVSGSKITRMEKKVRLAIMDAHRKTVSSLANARYVDAPGSGHMIMYTEPAIIVNEVLGMLRKV